MRSRFAQGCPKLEGGGGKNFEKEEKKKGEDTNSIKKTQRTFGP